MANPLDVYIPFIKFLGLFAGQDIEFILYDTSKEQIHYVETLSYKIEQNKRNRTQILEDEIYKDRILLFNYRSLTKDMKTTLCYFFL